MSSIVDIQTAFKKGEIHMLDRVYNFLQVIEEKRSLNAFLTVYADEARAAAKDLDARRDAGETLGPLAGLVIALKDNICLENQKTTCGSKILEDFVSPYSATVAQKILAADGIIIGKTNLDEFAMGSSTENSAFGPALNPHDKFRVPGGSSGGSAVAVAAGMTDLALGSDTGGSIRQPASFCGIVGMKPSYGRVSRYGLVAFASSLDQIGPFSKSVVGSALLLQTIAGADLKDATCSAEDVPELFPIVPSDAKKLRVGIPREFYEEGLDPEIRLGLVKTIERLKTQGAEVKDLSLSLTEYAIATYYIIATAEASSNLSRYDGVRYGHRSEDVKGLQNMYEKSRSEGFGVEVKRRIMLGTYVLSSGYYDAYYKKAQQVRRLISEEYQQAFQDVDVLLTPTTPGRAFTLGDKVSDPLEMYLQDIYTVTANLAGICALSLPVKTTAGEMPYGVQLLAGAFQEKLLFQAAALLESL
ncbi:MAG: Asp-tRNA(Asn)/Glu-tRNA(Gln) amidotransferase subunit GatA [Calditrichia bacterium]